MRKDVDVIDQAIRQWRQARPDLSVQPLAVVARILRLAGHLERRADKALQPFGLPLWAFDVLSALLRSGPPFAMTPTELMHSVLLSSGAMTHRIDRLEKQGLVERQPDPGDRRSLRVVLTGKGLQAVEQASAARFAEARDALRGIPQRQARQLAQQLQAMLAAIEGDGAAPTSRNSTQDSKPRAGARRGKPNSTNHSAR